VQAALAVNSTTRCVCRHDSLQELLLVASWASEQVLLDRMLPKARPDQPCIYIIDDLDVLQLDDASDEMLGMDHERRLLYNCLLQTIDRLTRSANSIIAGVARNPSRLPPSLVKAGRLEKTVKMDPPTQRQREMILLNLLQATGCNGSTSHNWSVLLASATAGCVAADLCRLAADACTNSSDGKVTSPKWPDWKAAARSILPSQLAAFDVTKPALFIDQGHVATIDWQAVHEQSWKSFHGYASLKKRVFRTVVAPWRRRLNRDPLLYSQTNVIAPPSGVLFHGSSGCGKTHAANCLGSSLGLPMIRVRASDVLDKWLGGSEEAIRTLFTKARAAAPCVLFFDEIDAIATNRGTDAESADVMSRLLSTMLNELDGVSSRLNDDVLVVACTNRLDTLDAALLRPGRLEEHVELMIPSLDDAHEMLRQQFMPISLGPCVDLHEIATDLVSKRATAADMEGVAREAVFRCLRDHSGGDNVVVTRINIAEAMQILSL
jgi:transitional endoplasmic reticulum ATPase